MRRLHAETYLYLTVAVMVAVVAAAGLSGHWAVRQQRAIGLAALQSLHDGGAAAELRQATARMDEESSALSRTVAGGMAGWAVLGLVFGLIGRECVRRSGGVSLRDATRMVQRVAEGDLTVTVHAMHEGHTRKLAQALQDMTAGLRHLVSEVVESARMVAQTSAQIAQGNLDLSQRTEEQASTLEETASSMEQLTSTVAQNAENARQASELAQAASDVARRGGQAMGQVVSTMNGISESSRRIGDIIGVIDGIAFQTNILALNAAVEAARAGEQGRGFAVVAAEVRSLAQKSAAAAKEIKVLIGDSVGKVETGTRMVDAAGQTMNEIVDSVRKVSELIAEIAVASREQSVGIGQINTAVAQMEQVVQQNATLVEEASAATEAMKHQSESLLQVVERFRLAETESQMAQPQPAGARTALVPAFEPAYAAPRFSAGRPR